MSNPNQFFPNSGSYQPPGGGFYPPPPQPKKGGSSLWIVLGILGMGAALLFVVCCGGLIWVARPPVASAAAKKPFQFADVPPPNFPAFEDPDTVEPGVQKYVIELGDDDDGDYDPPGHGGVMWLYLPAGRHGPKSLPCILIAPAGSTLLTGMPLADGDQPEHVPYVKAGCAVLAYELDGHAAGTEIDALQEAYPPFKASRAGLVNARNALEYVLAKVPEVDPKHIYAAGHSSAATHALLFAEHEPRLAGVLAYAPAPDLPKRMRDQMPVYRFIMPGLADFVTQSSPTTHAASLKCPVFLFHSQEDGTCPIADTAAFAEQLKKLGADVKYVTVPTGDHYNSMKDQGIPAGIEWLKQHGAID